VVLVYMWQLLCEVRHCQQNIARQSCEYSHLSMQTSWALLSLQTNLHLRSTTLGYGFQFQHRNPRTFPIESLTHDSERSLVCAEYSYPRDLQIPTVKEEIRRYSSQYSTRLSAHPNDLIVNLIELPDNRRLRRHLPNDLPTRFLV
jgi:hypothetical protein